MNTQLHDSNFSNETHNTAIPPDSQQKTTAQVENFHKGVGLRRSCDRCHTQKLKCSRGRALFSQCLRCQRVGLSCSYSARSARKTATRNNELEVTSSAIDKDLRETRAPELPMLDEIELATLDNSLNMSFNIAQDDFMYSISPQDCIWWGQPLERYISEESAASITVSTPNTSTPEFMSRITTNQQVSPASESTSGVEARRSDLFQRITDLSQGLESAFNRIAISWSEQDIQSCKHLSNLYNSICYVD